MTHETTVTAADPKMNVQYGSRPIGVFDSGLGGLTVLKALRERFPHESFIYLGDTARIPYGSKSEVTIARYLEQNLSFLTSLNIKAAIVACNSASTAVLDRENVLNELFKLDDGSPMPVYNVIEPGAKMAARISKNGLIGVMGTRATVAKKSYVNQIAKINGEHKIFQQACPLLVPLVEEGWVDDPITNLIVYRYISPFLSVGVDTLVLGCTHYPLLAQVIRKVVGAGVELVDSGSSIVEVLEHDFESGRLAPDHSGEASDVKFLSTDVSETFQAFAQKIMSPLPIRPFEWVNVG